MSYTKKRIYADAAAATPLSLNVRKELVRLLGVYGNAGALHKEGSAAKKELESARGIVASSIGAHPDEIVFTASGTEGNNLAAGGILGPLLEIHGELHVLTTPIEHHSVLEPLLALETQGLYITELDIDKEGLISPKMLAEAITDETAYVSVHLVNNEIGTIEPIHAIAKEIRRIRKKRLENKVSLPIYFHCDAAQAPLWLSIKVESLGVDLMTLDGQKVLGPKGVGALYVRRGVPLTPVIRGGKQEYGLRAGTANVPLVGAFAHALKEAQEKVVFRSTRVSAIRDSLFSDICSLIPEAVLNGPTLEHRVANNLNISIPGLEGETAVIAMDAQGIAISTRSACNANNEESSHVIKALGGPHYLANTAMRITLMPDITKNDARRIAQSLAYVARQYKTVV